jgi:hypothetical protein
MRASFGDGTERPADDLSTRTLSIQPERASRDAMPVFSRFLRVPGSLAEAK